MDEGRWMSDRLWRITGRAERVRSEVMKINANERERPSLRDLLTTLERQAADAFELVGMVRHLQNEIVKLEHRLEGVDDFKEVCRQEYERHLSEQAEQSAQQFSQMAGDI